MKKFFEKYFDETVREVFFLEKEWKKFSWLGRCTAYPFLLICVWIVLIIIGIAMPIDKFILQPLWKVIKPILLTIFLNKKGRLEHEC